jgi:hypothetical protein
MPKLTTRSSKEQQRRVVQSSYHHHPAVALCSIVTLPTQRKVSEEDIHSSSSEASSQCLPQLEKISSLHKFNLDGSYRAIHRSSSSLSSSDASSQQQQEQQRQSSYRLKRPAPSVCLVELATQGSCHSTTQHCVSPVTTTATPSHFGTPQPLLRGVDTASETASWGHFIDMLIPDHQDDDDYYTTSTSFLPSCPSPFNLDRLQHSNNPYPKPEKRRRIQSSSKQPLRGFFLASPTVEDAASQLSSLSF